MNTGYILVWRKLRDNPLWSRSSVLHLALNCLFEANHTKRTFPFNGEMVTVERGQFITGRDTLCKQTGLSPMQIRTSLAYLRDKASFLTTKTTNRYTIITICNYDSYQTIAKTNNQVINQPTTSPQPAHNQPITTTNTLKNEKNENNEPLIAAKGAEIPQEGAWNGMEGMEENISVGGKPSITHPNTSELDADFVTFYSAYPRKEAKGAALRAWKKAKAKTTLGIMLKAISIQKQTDQWLKDNGQYIPMPATWLNGERWADVVKGPCSPTANMPDMTAELMARRREREAAGNTNQVHP